MRTLPSFKARGQSILCCFPWQPQEALVWVPLTSSVTAIHSPVFLQEYEKCLPAARPFVTMTCCQLLPDPIRGRIFRLAVIVSCHVFTFWLITILRSSLWCCQERLVIELKRWSLHYNVEMQYFQKYMSCLAVIGDWKYVIFLCHNLCGSPCVQSVLQLKKRFKLSLTTTVVITFTEYSKVFIRNGPYISH